MPELRKDPVTGRWVIVATERRLRPADFTAPRDFPESEFCPFCEGREDHTPPEIAAVRETGTEPDGPGWQVRVIPNKFPALRPEGELESRGEGIYDVMNGIGAHEIMVDSPRHIASLTQLTPAEVVEVLRMYRARLVDLSGDTRFRYGMVFKNVGVDASATLEHSHSQLIAVPMVPSAVARELDGARHFHEFRGRCLFCDILTQEHGDRRRVVFENDECVAMCPFASRFPFEVVILPREHRSHFEDEPEVGVEGFAEALLATLALIERALDSPPYNFMLHTGPFRAGALEHFHWHLEIIPRLTKTAGFEWGTGFYINPVAPEDAARFLRECVRETPDNSNGANPD